MTKISKKFKESLKMLGYSISNDYRDYFILKITEDIEVMFTNYLNPNVYMGIFVTSIPNSSGASIKMPSFHKSELEFINKIKCLYENVKLKGTTLYIDVGDDL